MPLESTRCGLSSYFTTLTVLLTKAKRLWLLQKTAMSKPETWLRGWELLYLLLLQRTLMALSWIPVDPSGGF